jgi:hypothetical protein
MLEDDVGLIAMGVSELGNETTIKIWVSEREDTSHVPVISEHQVRNVPNPRQSKVLSEPFPYPCTSH